MTSLKMLQEIDAWLSFNNSPSKEQISELRNDIKKHIGEQLNILPVNQQRELLAGFYEHLEQIDKPLRNGNGYKEADGYLSENYA